MSLTVISVAYPLAAVTDDPVGGAERVLRDIDRGLVEAGHRSIVIAAEGSTTSGELVAIPSVQSILGNDVWCRLHEHLRACLPRIIAETDPDIVHMHGVDFGSYLPPAGAPVLATLHLPRQRYAAECMDITRPRTWLNAVSVHQSRSFAGHPRCVGAIENGVDTSAPQTCHAKRSFALAMGRICREKGFHLALDAARRAGVPLLLAGDVYPYPEHHQYFCQEIFPRLDVQRCWIGPIGGARKRRLLQSARCLLAPSLIAETASLVAREALAAGTPVIAYPSGALAETVEPGRTGFLVSDVDEMASSIRRTAEISPETCRSVARERFCAKRMVGEYIALYQRLAGDG